MFFIFTPDYDAKLKKVESNSKYFTQFLWRKLKKVPKKYIGMKDLESRIKKKLSEQSMTIQRLATESGISEPTLHAIFNRGDAKLSQLEKIASALETSLSFLLGDESQTSVIQTGGFDQSGGGNFQKVKVSKAPTQELAAQLDSCQREVDHLKEKLVYANQTIASKDETISLLRGSYSRPN